MTTNVLLVSSWGTPCGIASHSEMLIAAVEAADPSFKHYVDERFLDPAVCFRDWGRGWPITVLNYHRALHSRWTPNRVAHLKERSKVIVVMHDSYGESEPDQLSQDLCDLADAFIVHEPCQGLPKAIYLRMGVPAYTGLHGHLTSRLVWFQRPILGTVGFHMAHKNWPELARITRKVGWGFCICTPAMTTEDEVALRAINPWLIVHRDLSTEMVVAELHVCDATAFVNVTGGSGQSAAILLGIAARKPVIALETCRQYRSLLADDLGKRVICWVEDFAEVETVLTLVPLGRFDTGIVALAEQDSLEKVGQRYAEIYRRLSS